VPLRPVGDDAVKGRVAGRDALAEDPQDRFGVRGGHRPGGEALGHRLCPRASTGQRPSAKPFRATTNSSNCSTTGQTWLGTIATTPPRRGAGAPSGIETAAW